MYIKDKRLDLVVDMYGCPNRCLHCWLGHSPNIRMDTGADEFIVGCFEPYFDKIAFYSWAREPDYCDGYKHRWEKDIALSKNARPQRFELASFYRIVRDKEYIPFLLDNGVKKVQLSFFGLKDTQDRYVGRRGAYEEVMKATELLTDGGIIPRWQCFINEENKDEIVEIYKIAQSIRQNRCPELEFFVHEGSCDGENRKLYNIRINKKDIPAELILVFLGHDKLLTERECCALLENDFSSPSYHNEDEIVLYVSNKYDVYFNFTNMSEPWVIGNLKTTPMDELVSMIVNENTPAMIKGRQTSWAELVRLYGDKNSEKAFDLEDYKMYLFNNYLEDGGRR